MHAHPDRPGQVACLALLPAPPPVTSTSAPSDRVVAFGDVHGAYDDWVKLLQQTGIIDSRLNWSGGRTHLVSLGDLIDRGPGRARWWS